MIRIKKEKLSSLLLGILNARDINIKKGEYLVNNLVRSDLRGIRSHGINNFTYYLNLIENGTIDPDGEPVIINETATTALVDGQKGFGQYVCTFATKKAIEKAKKNVIGTITVRNSGHVGHVSDYTRMISDENMIGIIYVSCDKSVAPFGGCNLVLGTNPLSYALPAGKEKPIVVDFATSATAGSKLAHYLRKGDKIPEGWAISSDGEIVTDPRKLFANPTVPIKWGDNFTGSLLPAAGHKGYGLALFIDVITGALTGGRVNGEIIDGENFAFIQAINPDGFIQRDLYSERVDKLIRACKASKLQVGVKEILIPGEPENKHEEECLKLGIPIEEELWKEINSLINKK